MATNRLQILMDDQGLDSIDRLPEAFRLRRSAAVVDRPVTFLEWVAAAQAEGRAVGAKNVAGTFERVLLDNTSLQATESSLPVSDLSAQHATTAAI